MSGQAQRGASGEALEMAELRPTEQQVAEGLDRPQQSLADVCVQLVTRAVARLSPGGTRRASATTTTTITVPEVEEQRPVEERPAEVPSQEAAEQVAAPPPPPPPRPARWVIGAGRRRGGVATEPGEGNASRALTLLVTAGWVRTAVSAEAWALSKLQEQVESAAASRFRALASARLWLLELLFERRVRAHLQAVFGQMRRLHAERHRFLADAVAAQAGGPALRLLDDLACPEDDLACPQDRPGDEDASNSGRHAPEDKNIEDSGTSSSSSSAATAPVGDQEASEVEQAGAEPCGSSIGAGEQLLRQARLVHSKSHRRLETAQTAVSSGSSSAIVSRSDSLRDCTAALQQPSGEAFHAAAVDSLQAAVEESEASAAMATFRELQRQFQQVTDALRQHALVADGVLRQAGLRRLPEVHEGQWGPSPQQMLLHDIALMHSEMQLTQKLMSQCWTEAERVADAALGRTAAPRASPPAAAAAPTTYPAAPEAAPCAPPEAASVAPGAEPPASSSAASAASAAPSAELAAPVAASEAAPGAQPAALTAPARRPRFGRAWFSRILAASVAPGAEPPASTAAPSAELAAPEAASEAAPDAELAVLTAHAAAPARRPRFGRAWFSRILATDVAAAAVRWRLSSLWRQLSSR